MYNDENSRELSVAQMSNIAVFNIDNSQLSDKIIKDGGVLKLIDG